MTAKEAAAKSKKVAAAVKIEQDALIEAARIEREKEYNGAVDFLLKQFNEEWLPDAIKRNTRYYDVSTTRSKITSDLAKERLMKNGYKVSHTEVFHHDS